MEGAVHAEEQEDGDQPPAQTDQEALGGNQELWTLDTGKYKKVGRPDTHTILIVTMFIGLRLKNV